MMQDDIARLHRIAHPFKAKGTRGWWCTSGPWDEEGDAYLGTVGGFTALILRHPTMGHLCGYLRVPDKVLAAVDDERIKVHGGVTWRGPLVDLGALVRHETVFCPFVTLYMEGNTWIGFDCTHAGDLRPSTGKDVSFPLDGYQGEPTYKSVAYVVAELKNLASQISKLLKEKTVEAAKIVDTRKDAEYHEKIDRLPMASFFEYKGGIWVLLSYEDGEEYVTAYCFESSEHMLSYEVERISLGTEVIPLKATISIRRSCSFLPGFE